ncbi:maleylpyruvate isomerase family mycothiol-dependent enzyme [Paramicrobacterium fandaimingii]|uniref:maleylpyruvate isomerase family mycothiol-dependent enzyme n=1 Tax=Paramicrobacterium fandaimingii TaxID=2708079 RepID=UPI001422457B|nr:maleylpyruvate isomerase family mycothiol-dependent enzyme [Microbacterium fandaimingii]
MDQIVAQNQAERRRLVQILEGLSAEQWDSPSLCDGWRVREVVAHITMPFRTSPIRFFAGVVRARFNFNRFADWAARADTRSMDDSALLEQLRRNVEHPWRPPGGGAVGALSHDVIHGLDITEALGLPGPPPERVGMVLRESQEKNLAYFGVDLRGQQLVATDADAAVGQGAPVEMRAVDILLVITGRRPLANAVEGTSPA